MGIGRLLHDGRLVIRARHVIKQVNRLQHTDGGELSFDLRWFVPNCGGIVKNRRDGYVILRKSVGEGSEKIPRF